MDFALKMYEALELFVKSLKEGWNCGFDPSLTKLSIKSSSCFGAYFESWVQILESTSFHISKRCPKSHTGLCNASLAHTIQQDK